MLNARNDKRHPVFPQLGDANVKTGAIVLLLAIIVGLVAAVLGYNYAQANYRAEGTIVLTELAGNRPAFELNTFTADLQSALNGPEVRRAVQGSVPEGAVVTPIEVSRVFDSSRVTVSLSAESAPLAERALLAAGRTAYSQVVDQQRELLEVRFAAAQSRLEALNEAVERLRLAIDEGPEEAQASQEFLLDQQRQAVGIAVADLADAQGGLAVVDQIDLSIESSNVVSVGEVYATSVLPQVLRVTVAGLLGGALIGVLIAFAVRSRQTRLWPDPQSSPTGIDTPKATTPSTRDR